MRVGLYELQVVDQNGVALPERCIGGRYYVEANPGQEFRIKSTIHKDVSGLFPVSSSAVRLHVDGKSIYHWTMNTLDQDGLNSVSHISNAGYYDGIAGQWHALKFGVVNTNANFNDSDKSKTGEVKIEFSETKTCSAYRVNHTAFPAAPMPENNKPYKQPSLTIEPGRVISFNPPRSMLTYMRKRKEPESILQVK